MPSEVSDIKQFIEICRRKDASCTFYNSPARGGLRKRRKSGGDAIGHTPGGSARNAMKREYDARRE
jgi:hypothetical protein